MKNSEKYYKEILYLLSYFVRFHYAPTVGELHTFLRLKITQPNLEKLLETMAKNRKIIKKTLKMPNSGDLPTHFFLKVRGRPSRYYSDNLTRYTLLEYASKFKVQSSKLKVSWEKIRKIEPYVRLISLFPQIKLVGLSGSVAMLNAERSEDIDLFIITAKNRLFTGRFIALILAQILNLRRKRVPDSRFQIPASKDKVCLNLFFDGKRLGVPKFKQNEYVAREVLQMKPAVAKDDIFSRYLDANKWVFDIFPNAPHSDSNFFNSVMLARISKPHQFGNLFYTRDQVVKKSLSSIGNVIENLIKKLQLLLINRHRTTELIMDRQLWFFPDDFEKKIKIDKLKL